MAKRTRELPVKAGRLKRKTPYFLQPTNTLTEPPVKTPVKSVHPPKSSPREEFVDHHSSDDSFDGVRWRTSPRRILQPTVTSSPLKNVTVKHELVSQTVADEQTNTILLKYGYGGVLSQTPKLNRTQSEELTKRERLHKSPGLSRAKLLEKGSLQSWMERLLGPPPPARLAESVEVDQKAGPAKHQKPDTSKLNPTLCIGDSTKSTTTTDTASLLTTTPLVLLNPRGAVLVCEPALSTPLVSALASASVKSAADLLAGIDFSDDFSDSEIKSSSPSKPKNHENKDLLETDSDDPFTDDDDEILAALTQAPKTGGEPAPVAEGVELNKKVLSPSESVSVVAAGTYSTSFKAEVTSYTRSHTDVNAAKLLFSRKDFVRLQITSITKSSYKLKDRVRQQLVVGVRDGEDAPLKVIVRGEYTQLDFEVGDVIHIILTAPSNPRLVDDNHNLLIWNPDILVASTTIAEQLRCPRKSVIMHKFKFPAEININFVTGNILHEIFQACFVSDDWRVEFMDELLEEHLEANLLQIYNVGDVVDSVRQDVRAQFLYLHLWFNKYYKKVPQSVPTNKHNQSVKFAINDALDIEETIWLPMFGLKGMVDVTLDASFEDQKAAKRVLLPMEIKTGREYVSHHAQLTLYALLFKDRYDIDAISFLLVYTKEQITRKHDINPLDLKALVNLRNRLTKFLKDNCMELPDLQRLAVCDRCDVQEPCMALNKMTEGGNAEASGIEALVYDDHTAHLDKQEYRDFYLYWDTLITKEETVFTRTKRDLWTMTAEARELDGKALCHLVISESNDHFNQNEFIYTFVRDPGSSVQALFQNAQLGKFDRVVVSDETGRFAIALGLIMHIMPQHITILSKRRILNTDFSRNAFNGGDTEIVSVLHATQAGSQRTPRVTFRIDKDDMFYGMGLARFNLLNLFLALGDSKRRDLIVNRRAPRFGQPLAKKIGEQFNPDQVSAFKKVLSCKDYALILGMPGTGKTTVIAELIRVLVENGKLVLLSSYTHSAVDNILLKVKDFGIDILRIGASSRIHPDLAKFDPNSSAAKPIETHNDYLNTYKNPRVVAVTCLGVNDVAFTIRTHFDYCIIDEASQVSMPVSLGPLRLCDKFVLVGDHHQLPPLVTHPTPEVRQGLSQSLFKMLSERHPESVVELTHQYRMCEEIMLLCNVLVYDHRLKCGLPEVAGRSLKVPYADRISSYLAQQYASSLSKNQLWLDLVMEPSNKVLFLNHDNLPALERTLGEKVENPTEVELTRHIVAALSVGGVADADIGVMSLYRHQLRALKRTFLDRPEVEVLTADQYQGRDKECVVISLVRSNPERKVGDLLREWRRVNVAITRSRSKLILLGSKSTLSNCDTLRGFMDLLGEKGWIYDLPQDADHFYAFPFSPLQKKVVRAKIDQESKFVKGHPIIRDIVNEMT